MKMTTVAGLSVAGVALGLLLYRAAGVTQARAFILGVLVGLGIAGVAVLAVRWRLSRADVDDSPR